MSYSTNMIVLKSHVGCAMKNQLNWDTLVSLFNEFCTTYEKAVEANHVLLDQLKMYKEIQPKVSVEKDSERIFKEENHNDVFADEVPDQDHLVDIKTEYIEESNEAVCKKDVAPEDFEEERMKSDHELDEEKFGIFESDKEENDAKESDLETNDEKVKCDTCGMLISKGNLSRHIKNVHQKIPRSNNKLYIKSTCDRCGKVFDCEDYMKKHQKYSCHSEKAYKCDKCDAVFKHNQGLTEHKRIKHDGLTKMFSCEHCGKTFDRKTCLTIHLKYVHEKVEKAFKCDQCTNQFISKSRLQRHVKTVHQGARDYMCSECGVALSSAHNLKNHIVAVHRKEKPHKCDFCDQAFGERPSLIKHKKSIHEKEKHECKKCGKQFSQKQTLNMHIKVVHEGFIPYKCDECEKGFNLKGLLRDHVLMVHKGINPYVCDYCDKVFTQAHMMRTHMKNNSCKRA